ncbi:hypothetical protein LWI28_024716 [Acer negundo]|uniref:BURP domain-containing protein n=1 Tax=Acer negundo TaxID=4023 RepID=A0AAD5NNY8_ACENE|nr:hypothetical protein LWI28_024716 [Acer negundo]
MLKEGTVMPMPDIKDKMLERSFLPWTIVSKLPFSSSKMSAMKQIFHAIDNSTMERIMKDALNDCERTPSQGETKRCVASAEDMIDFATSVLGHDVALRTTESVKGSKQNILVGTVKGINGGKVTKSVSCHQRLFPCYITATLCLKSGFTKRIFWILKPRVKSTTESPFVTWTPLHGARPMELSWHWVRVRARLKCVTGFSRMI